MIQIATHVRIEMIRLLMVWSKFLKRIFPACLNVGLGSVLSLLIVGLFVMNDASPQAPPETDKETFNY